MFLLSWVQGCWRCFDNLGRGPLVIFLLPLTSSFEMFLTFFDRDYSTISWNSNRLGQVLLRRSPCHLGQGVLSNVYTFLSESHRKCSYYLRYWVLYNALSILGRGLGQRSYHIGQGRFDNVLYIMGRQEVLDNVLWQGILDSDLAVLAWGGRGKGVGGSRNVPTTIECESLT